VIVWLCDRVIGWLGNVAIGRSRDWFIAWLCYFVVWWFCDWVIGWLGYRVVRLLCDFGDCVYLDECMIGRLRDLAIVLVGDWVVWIIGLLCILGGYAIGWLCYRVIRYLCDVIELVIRWVGDVGWFVIVSFGWLGDWVFEWFGGWVIRVNGLLCDWLGDLCYCVIWRLCYCAIVWCSWLGDCVILVVGWLDDWVVELLCDWVIEWLGDWASVRFWSFRRFGDRVVGRFVYSGDCVIWWLSYFGWFRYCEWLCYWTIEWLDDGWLGYWVIIWLGYWVILGLTPFGLFRYFGWSDDVLLVWVGSFG